jgi:hypothetical protein
MGERNVYIVLVVKLKVKRPLGRISHIKGDLKEIQWNWIDWIHLLQEQDLW